MFLKLLVIFSTNDGKNVVVEADEVVAVVVVVVVADKDVKLLLVGQFQEGPLLLDPYRVFWKIKF